MHFIKHKTLISKLPLLGGAGGGSYNKSCKPILGRNNNFLVIKDPPLSPLPRGEISYEHNLQENK